MPGLVGAFLRIYAADIAYAFRGDFPGIDDLAGTKPQYRYEQQGQTCDPENGHEEQYKELGFRKACPDYHENSDDDAAQSHSGPHKPVEDRLACRLHHFASPGHDGRYSDYDQQRAGAVTEDNQLLEYEQQYQPDKSCYADDSVYQSEFSFAFFFLRRRILLFDTVELLVNVTEVNVKHLPG